MNMFSSHKPSQVMERRILMVALLGCLVLLNVVGLGLFYRLDLTQNREFTLSDATKSALGHLKEPITIRAYFTSDLPPPHATQARYVKDLLESYYAQGKGRVRFEFIDPMGHQTAEEADKKKQLKRDVFGNTVREPTEMERELEAMGIPPVQVRVNQADKVEVKRAYMGLALHYQDRHEVIPVVTETQGLEYDLTSMIRKVAQERTQKLAVVTGHDQGTGQEAYGRALSALKEHYEISQVDLTEAGTLLPEADALLVVGPSTPFSPNEVRTIEAFVHAGHAAAFFLPPVHAQLQGLTVTDNDHGLGPMLARFGVQLGSGLVLDADCATISVQQQTGYMRVNQPVRYPYIAQLENFEVSPITQGVRDVMMGFMGPLEVTAAQGGPIRAQVLARSSARSWQVQPPYNLDPMQRWSPDAKEMRPAPTLVALEGPMGRVEGAQEPASEAQNARVLVAASDSLVQDAFMGKGNETLLLNAMDWLLGDDSLLAVRSRGMAAAALEDVGEARRRTLKYGNILGLPLSFVALGALRWRRREARRTQDLLS